MFHRPCKAVPGGMRAERRGEELSFQSFLQHATLFLPRFNTEFVSPGKWRHWFGLIAAAENRCETGRMALLEIEILSKAHRDPDPTDEPGGFATFPVRTREICSARAGRSLLVAGAVIAGAVSLAWQQAGWGQAAPGGGDSAAATTAARSSAPAPGTTTLQVYSRLTVVDVTVTDAKGQPVHGLKESDFTVKEDGKPQPVRNFLEVREDEPPAARESTQAAARCLHQRSAHADHQRGEHPAAGRVEHAARGPGRRCARNRSGT